ncbi:D-amino-acid transaminase [Planococcus lenghuensis]|uniref:D-alanine aminotransferase n=1 Tax=Planococcus lenghuensis TaxID=2213202 RepID=A0A1Q2KX51_9BACL|nr:D-amino-acid transaminase [Planococcus lenghuensis]AQQ52770.1 D-amino-acid transaminase [Planococcus lenghuensis]
MNWILLDDQLVKEEQVNISKEDRGYQFGDGVYEVIRIYEGDLFTGQEHIDRFYESAQKIRLVIPYTKDVLQKMVHELVEANEVINGYVYMQITRGASPRQHQFPEQGQPVLTGYTKLMERPIELMRNGVHAKFVEDVRWLRCDIKSLNLLGNVLAKQEAMENDCYEAVLHRGETVTEGSSSNVYGIKDGVIYTHPADNHILNGITRREIIAVCAELGIPFEEKAFTKEAAHTMDELFISSTTAEVLPVTVLDAQPIGDGTPGETTRRLQQAFERRLGLKESALA